MCFLLYIIRNYFSFAGGNSHIFTHKGNGLVAEKERYRENPTHHVDYK